MIYDLIVVGNGIAAQTFLLELFSHLKLDVNKSQNFSIAQLYSEDIAPSCSLRSTASVSLNGIEEGVSELGNDLRKSFYLFEDFFSNHNPAGVEKVKQYVTYSSELERSKMLRRFKNLSKIQNSLFNREIEGVELDSYLVAPKLHSEWFTQKNSLEAIDRKKDFLKTLTQDADGLQTCELMSGQTLKARKVVLCTGAYAKVFSQFHLSTTEIETSQVISGAFLQKTIKLPMPSFYITINRHNLIYRNSDQTLILGSASLSGPFCVGDSAELKKIFQIVSEFLSFSLGSFDEFKVMVGLRHKGVKRLAIAKALNDDKSIYMINGLYKNGFSSALLCSQRILSDIFIS